MGQAQRQPEVGAGASAEAPLGPGVYHDRRSELHPRTHARRHRCRRLPHVLPGAQLADHEQALPKERSILGQAHRPVGDAVDRGRASATADCSGGVEVCPGPAPAAGRDPGHRPTDVVPGQPPHRERQVRAQREGRRRRCLGIEVVESEEARTGGAPPGAPGGAAVEGRERKLHPDMHVQENTIGQLGSDQMAPAGPQLVLVGVRQHQLEGVPLDRVGILGVDGTPLVQIAIVDLCRGSTAGECRRQRDRRTGDQVPEEHASPKSKPPAVGAEGSPRLCRAQRCRMARSRPPARPFRKARRPLAQFRHD